MREINMKKWLAVEPFKNTSKKKQTVKALGALVDLLRLATNNLLPEQLEWYMYMWMKGEGYNTRKDSIR